MKKKQGKEPEPTVVGKRRILVENLEEQGQAVHMDGEVPAYLNLDEIEARPIRTRRSPLDRDRK
mgnify:CR=1 FL=1